MNRKAAVAAATALISATALTGATVSADSAAARSTTHTTRLVLHQTGDHQIGGNSFAGTDRAMSRATGKVVGFDAITGTFNRKTHDIFIQVALALKGGIVLGNVTLHEGVQRFHGPITHGSGAFSGISGTITGRQVGDGTKTFVTLHWQL